MKKKITPYRVVQPDAWRAKDFSKVLKLDWNEATIPPAPGVFSAISEELLNGNLNWYPNIKNDILYSKISFYTKIEEDYIEIFAGSDSLHEVITKSLVQEGDIISIVSPTYDNFRSTVELSGAFIDHFYLDDLFFLDFDKLSKRLYEIKPKILYIVNPNNPTGNAHDFIRLSDLINKHSDVIFVIDEAYYEFYGYTFSNLVKTHDNLIICRTFSKAFALASFRIGYTIASLKLIDSLRIHKNTKSVPQLAQVAAVAALNNLTYTDKYVKDVSEAKYIFMAQLINYDFIKYFPSDSNFILLKCLTKEIKIDLLNYFSKREIYVRDFIHLAGMDNFFRITIGRTCDMKQVIEAIKNFANENNLN